MSVDQTGVHVGKKGGLKSFGNSSKLVARDKPTQTKTNKI